MTNAPVHQPTAGRGGRSRIDVAAYYRQITAVDIGAVARELLSERVTQESPTHLLCDCPNHQSSSHTSLHVSLHQGLWCCFGCGEGGDVLQLVEFVHHRSVTKGVRGPMTDSHREARDWLAARAGLPPLGRSGLSPEEIETEERRRRDADSVFDVLTALATHYHERLLATPEVLEWIQASYGFSQEIIAQLKIGWSESPRAFERLVAMDYPDRVVASTGAFWHDQDGRSHPFFQKRVVFPYWSRGRVVYMIGRRTPWTSSIESERAKYKKLPVHNQGRNAHISRAIDNSVLFGEDVLLSRPQELVQTEGVTDAIASQQAGIPTISPVTVRLKRADADRIARKLRGIQTVYLVQDNELSGVGQDGALTTARAYEDAGIRCLVATLPLLPKHEAARKELASIVGQELLEGLLRLPARERRKAILDRVADDPAKVSQVEKLVEDSKVDLCEWLREYKHDAEAFRRLVLNGAREALDVVIDMAQVVEGDKRDQITAIETILREIGEQRPAAREDHLRRLKSRTGLSLDVLRKEAAHLARASKERSAATSPRSKAAEILEINVEVPSGSMLSLVEQHLHAARISSEPPDYSLLAEQAYEWILQHGGQFFRTRDGMPLMFWANEIWQMASPDPGPRKRFEGLIYRLARLVPTSQGPRTFYTVLAALAADRGDIREEFPWLHTRVRDQRLWVNMNTVDHSIAEVSPDGVRVVPNGANEQGIILRGDPKFEAFEYLPNADPDLLDQVLQQLVGRYMACPWDRRQPILDWFCCFPLIEFAGTRPMLRFEGASQSGKTHAAKMVTALMYGRDAQKTSTDAANWADSTRNPLVAIDNIETGNVTQGFLDFVLTAITGIAREKRASGTDSGVISERPTTLLLTTGIEPLGGDLEEVISRSFVVEFDKELQQDSIIQPVVLDEIRDKRNWLFSAILNRTAIVLELIRDGGHARAMQAIRRSIGVHEKSRCDEFLALMYLHRVASVPAARRGAMLDALEPSFGAAVRLMNATTAQTAQEASPVVSAILGLFTALAQHKGDSGAAYGLSCNDAGTAIREATPALLLNALKTVSRDRGIYAPWKNAAQFGRRLMAAKDLLQAEGFDVVYKVDRCRRKQYTIARVDPGGLFGNQDGGEDGAPDGGDGGAPPPGTNGYGNDAGHARSSEHAGVAFEGLDDDSWGSRTFDVEGYVKR